MKHNVFTKPAKMRQGDSIDMVWNQARSTARHPQNCVCQTQIKRCGKLIWNLSRLELGIQGGAPRNPRDCGEHWHELARRQLKTWPPLRVLPQTGENFLFFGVTNLLAWSGF